MKKNKKSNKILLTLIFTLFLIVVGQLYLMNNIDSYNYTVERLISQYNTYNVKNQNLQGEISSNQSLISIKNNLLKKGYKNVNNVNYNPSNAYSFNVSSSK
jgi:hypothetical protein